MPTTERFQLAFFLPTLGIAYVSLVLGIGLFDQGLFFESEQLIFGLTLSGLALLFFALRNQKPIDLALGWLLITGWTVAILTTLPFAVRPESARTALVVASAGLFFYGQTRPNGRLGLTTGIVVALVSVAAIGLGVRFHLWGYPSAYDASGHLLNGTLQYHNTFAILSGVGLLLALGLVGDNRTTLWKRCALGSTASLLVFAVVLSLSRGVFVLLPLFLLIWVITRPAEQWVGAGLDFLAVSLPAAALIRPALDAADRDPVVSVALLVGGAAISGICVAVLHRRPIRTTARVGKGSLLAACLAPVILIAQRGLAARLLGHVLPQTVWARAGTIRPGSYDLHLRWVMDKVSWQLISHHPWIGYGAGAWKDLYHSVLSPYVVLNLTHNIFTQAWLEEGILGLTVWVLIVGYGIWRTWRARSLLERSVGLGMLVLLVHSAMDFNFSYMAVWLLLCSLLAALDDPTDGAFRIQLSSAWRWAGVVVSLLVVLLAGRMLVGQRLAQEAQGLLAHGKNLQAIEFYRHAEGWDPWQESYPEAQAEIWNGAFNNPHKAMPYALKAVQVRPDWVDGLLFVDQLSFELNQPNPTVAQRAVRLSPLRAEGYPYLVWSEERAAEAAFLKGDQASVKDDARIVFGVLSGFTGKLDGRLLFVPAGSTKTLRFIRGQVQLYAGATALLSGRIRTALQHLQVADSDPALRIQADLYLDLLYKETQNERGLEALSLRPWVRFLPRNPEYVALYDRIFGVDH